MRPPFSPFPIFSSPDETPPRPPMPIAPANKTFRKAVLPILSQLDILLDLPDQDLASGEAGIAAVVNFNFNNPTFFVDGEIVSLEDTTANKRVTAILSASNSQNQTFVGSESPGVVNGLMTMQMDASKGVKRKPGLRGSATLTNYINPANHSVVGTSTVRYNYRLMVAISAQGSRYIISGSSFYRLKFIAANPANPQTLAYDIEA